MADEEKNSGAPEMSGSTAPRAAQLKIKWETSVTLREHAKKSFCCSA
jgi:hypothetical protein